MATRQRSSATHRSSNGATRSRKRPAPVAAAVSSGINGVADMVMNRIKDLGTEAVQAADSHVRDMRDSANNYVKSGRKRAGRIERSVERSIEERPLMAVLAASIIGFVLGIVFARR